jgi:hypothetical protein
VQLLILENTKTKPSVIFTSHFCSTIIFTGLHIFTVKTKKIFESKLSIIALTAKSHFLKTLPVSWAAGTGQWSSAGTLWRSRATA